MYDKNQYQEIKEKASPRMTREQEFMPLIKMVHGASVVMQSLMTESNAWNRYLEILQGVMGRLNEEKIHAGNQLAGPDNWDTSELTKLKSNVCVLDGQIQILQDAMKLPKALIDGSTHTQEMINDFEKKYGQSTNTETTES